MQQNFTLTELLQKPVEDLAQLIAADGAAARDVVQALAAGAVQARQGEGSRETLERICEVLMHAEGESTQLMRAEALLDCCVYYYPLGLNAKAIAAGEQARHLALQGGSKPLARRACNMLGVFYKESLNFEAALRRLDEALLFARELNDRGMELAVQANVANTFLDMGVYRDAMRVGDQVLAHRSEHPGYPALKLQCLTNNLICAFNLRHTQAAQHYLAMGERLAGRQEIDPVGAAMFELYRAMLLIRDDQPMLAHQHVMAARAAPTTHPRVETLLAMAMGIAEVGVGRIDVGMTRLRKLYEKTRSSRIYHDDVLRALIEANERADNSVQALAYTEELIEYTISVKKAKYLEQLQAASVDAIQSPLEGSDEWRLAEDDAARHRMQSFRDKTPNAFETAQNWAILAGLVDDETGERCFRVGRLAGLLAREMGCGDALSTQIECAARLHDIGNIGISHAVLLKPGRFTPQELSLVRTHTAIGAELLQTSDDPVLQLACEIARHHHEWWNGDGYPDGLARDRIPLAARMVALADVYDALIRNRPHKRAMSHAEAIGQMVALRGTQFDPDLLTLFIKVAERRHRAGRSYEGDVEGVMQKASLFAARRRLVSAVGIETV